MTSQTILPTNAPRVPVTIVTGFLGAGKTSLINHLLTSNHGRRLAILVNDFGTVNIDATLIRQHDGDVVSLENGCICCSLSEGLLASAVRLIRQANPPEQIVIETSGVADPIDVARTFNDPELQPYAPLDGVITLVDSEQALQLEETALNLAKRQVMAADVALLNKMDLVDAKQRQLTQAWVQQLAPQARLLAVTHGKAPLDFILRCGGTALQVAPTLNQAYPFNRISGGDRSDFDTFTYESQDPLPIQRLHGLLSQLPKTVFRVKGILNLQEKPKHRCVLQATGRQAEIEVGQPWGDETPLTQIVFIGTQGGVDGIRFQMMLSGKHKD
ncbi:CobW family GTP-binding protein [Dapis sp. BLCC M172]|uniref:CobW family GTP-binding protein n=1 Tax=Dapis sp. BLCC M172 TaxID=2975281 RepID=UPI003CEF65DD